MDTLEERLKDTWQEHLIDALARLDGPARARLEAQLNELDLMHVRSLIRQLVQADKALPYADIEPPDVVGLPRSSGDVARDRHARRVGEDLLAEGRVAAVLVAGGQGTRLGFDGPKGAFPFGAISGRTLFAHHAAKIAAIRTRYGCGLPWYVMTSPQNDEATRAIFAANEWFDLDQESVRIFVQGTMPAVDRLTGRILLEAPDRVALSPDGHGGLFPALRRHGLLDDMRERGITTMFTFQVDNPLARVARPEFLGHHASGHAEMSSVVVRKRDPSEPVGIVARSQGKTVLVEYSDLPDEFAHARDKSGDLRFWAGSIAEHAIELSLAERVTDDGARLPFRKAIKRVPFVDDQGNLINPDTRNGVKFESFIFDALPLARCVVSVEVVRDEEFSPIKNAEGDDSPATARRDLNREYGRWLEAAGVAVPRDADSDPTVDIEIDPRYALDADQLAERIPPGFRLDSSVFLEAERGNGGRTAPE
jgi:UDP-N-acetylglucosamine/UDP-N-acetylgalactosamine diphosphorylase